MSQEKTSSEYVRTTSSSSDEGPRSTCIGRAAFIPCSDVYTVRTAGQELLTNGSTINGWIHARRTGVLLQMRDTSPLGDVHAEYVKNSLLETLLRVDTLLMDTADEAKFMLPTTTTCFP